MKYRVHFISSNETDDLMVSEEDKIFTKEELFNFCAEDSKEFYDEEYYPSSIMDAGLYLEERDIALFEVAE